MSPSAEAAAVAPIRRGFRFPPLGIYGYVCIAILLFWIVVAAFAPYIAPNTESAIVSGTSFAPIGAEGTLLGTDYLGRDLASRLVFGARTTLTLALVATILAFVLGVVTGFIAGIAGGWTDSIISRIVDAFISFPTIMLALLIVSIFGTSLPALVCAIGFIEATRGVPHLARARREHDDPGLRGGRPRPRREPVVDPLERGAAERVRAALDRLRPALHVLHPAAERAVVPRARGAAARAPTGARW